MIGDAQGGLAVLHRLRDQFVEANSLLSGTRSASFVAGPAVAGGLIQAVTAPVAMLVDAATEVSHRLGWGQRA